MSETGPCVLALDIGTSSARSILYDRAGSPLPGGSALQLPYAWRATPDGGMEAEAETLAAEVIRVIDAGVVAARHRGREIVGVATACFWHSLVGLGTDGEPLTPVYAWGDTRAAAAAARLRERLDPAEVHRRTGCFVDASYPSARLLWLRDTDPDIFLRVARWISFAEYLGLRLFGELRCSYSMASGTGLLDGWRLHWYPEMLDVVGLGEAALPPLVDLDEPFRGLRAEFARRWPALERVPWYPALGDGACANVGSGATGSDRVGLTLGTTAALRVVAAASEPVVVPQLWCYRLDRRRVAVGRALSNGGNAFAALEQWLRLPPLAPREVELAALGPDAHGLTVLPWLVGERGPGAPPAPGAALLGVTRATRPVEILRAWMEAVAYRIGEVAGALRGAFGEPSHFVLSGGALQASPVWRQIVVDVLGRRCLLSGVAESAARGAALMALEQLGLLPDALAAKAPAGASIDPQPAHTARYHAALERQRALAAALESGFLARGVQHDQSP